VRLQTFYSPLHEHHDPPNSREVPQRAQLLLEAMVEGNFGPITEAHNFGLRPILDIHTMELVALFQTAYRRFAALAGPRPVVPDSFAIGRLTDHSGSHIPRSIWGQLGHYCSDSLTPILEETWHAAYASVQVALSATHTVYEGAAVAYALCRPPGHHAYRDIYGGFCYLNNAAVAAHWLTKRGQRVAILDIDYHHGNGTQAIFYGRDDVFFCSIHADPEDEYPYYCGFSHEQGVDAGTGHTINYPLPLGTQEIDYLMTLHYALERIERFNPTTVIVSLGFDTVADDPEGKFQLSPNSFTHIGRQVGQIRRPLVIIQEGGYLLSSLAPCATNFFEGLLTAV
jgi:acetoin utilization deacetylase AcuC-like enzyme